MNAYIICADWEFNLWDFFWNVATVIEMLRNLPSNIHFHLIPVIEGHNTPVVETVLGFKILFSRSSIMLMAYEYFTGENIKKKTFKCKCQ